MNTATVVAFIAWGCGLFALGALTGVNSTECESGAAEASLADPIERIGVVETLVDADSSPEYSSDVPELVSAQSPDDAVSATADRAYPIPMPLTDLAGVPGGGPGEWIAADGRALPELLVWAQRDGSKTPLNLRLWWLDTDGKQSFIGCGVDGADTWCKLSDKHNRTTPRDVRPWISARQIDGVARLTFSQVEGEEWLTLEFKRGRVSAARRDGL